MRQGNLTKLGGLCYLDRFSTNVLLILFFSILLVFMGAVMSIILFTYQNSIQILESNKVLIVNNEKTVDKILENTREIPLQNREILKQINMTLFELVQNQALLEEHINQTTDIIGSASHFSPPAIRNALYAVAASNQVNANPPLTQELQTLLATINQSQQTILNLQEQVQNLSNQARENLGKNNTMSPFEQESAFPFAENRIQRTDIPENQSLTKEPEGGRIAGLPSQHPPSTP